jgi:hypothetical protein
MSTNKHTAQSRTTKENPHPNQRKPNVANSRIGSIQTSTPATRAPPISKLHRTTTTLDATRSTHVQHQEQDGALTRWLLLRCDPLHHHARRPRVASAHEHLPLRQLQAVHGLQLRRHDQDPALGFHYRQGPGPRQGPRGRQRQRRDAAPRVLRHVWRESVRVWCKCFLHPTPYPAV